MRIQRSLPFVLVASLALGVVACGQKGPLYLPDAPPAPAPAPATQPAPAPTP